jgi:putative ABC transport system substrate-binding protein
MRRREFIKLFVGSAAAWPLAARAQRAAMPKIGFLHVASPKPFEGIVAGFRQGLKQVGYTEHENVLIEFRWAEGDYNRLPTLAAELVRLPVAVIVTGGGEASALAAKAATRTIPIVCNLAADPVKTGLVAALNHPGGNITGVNILTIEMAAKRVGFLHDLLPASLVIAHLVNPNFASTEDAIQEVETAAGRLGLTIVLLKASSESDINAAFASIREKQIGALLVNSDAFFNNRRDQFVALAAHHAVPAVFAQREFAVAGGLMSYGTNLTDSYRQMGNYVGRILKGEKPADLPIVQSAKFELVINLKTANALGLTVPPGLLNAADEVIE